MKTLAEIKDDPNYVNANPETKAAIFEKFSANDENYTKANPETQAAIRSRFGIEAPKQPVQQPQTAQPKQEKPGLVDTMIRGAILGGPLGGTMAGVGYGLDKANEAVTQGAYDAGGWVTDKAAKVLPPEAAAGLGFATNVGLQAIPALVGGKGAGQAAAPAMENKAREVMQSALKPTLKQLQTGKAAQAIDTLLENGVNVSQGGLQVLRDKIGDLNRQIVDAVRNSPATVDKQSVYTTLKDTLDKFTRQVNPQSDISAINQAWKNFIDHPLLSGKNDIPVQLAQDLKQGTYAALSKKYGEVGGAETEAQKAISRGLKEGIAKAVPGISGLNAQESQLINALNVTERRVLMDANKNPGGLLWLAHNPSAAVAFAADRSPMFKSLLARMLYSGSERIPEAAAATAILTGEQLAKKQD